MNAHDLAPASAPRSPHLRACEPGAPWAARAFDEDVPPATPCDARAWRDELRTLLNRERAAAADFLLALADFDRRRGWERLGHASLFTFLTRELGLSAGAAQLRLSTARLLPRHPAVEAALRDGRLCLSAAGQLARVLTVENEAEVLPRFLGCSSREAAEVVASILPAAAPPRRTLLTAVVPAARAAPGPAPLALALAPSGAPAEVSSAVPPAAASPRDLPGTSGASLHAHEVGTCPSPRPSTPKVVPLTADLRRLHLTVTACFLEKMGRARTGLSHALPGATAEQVLEAALEALLARQASRKGLGRRALQIAARSPATVPAPATAEGPHRPNVPTSLERAIRLRDGDRCQYPLDAGGVCGSTWQVELDHRVPVALGGETSYRNLRCLCRAHNQAAAEAALGVAAKARRPRG